MPTPSPFMIGKTLLCDAPQDCATTVRVALRFKWGDDSIEVMDRSYAEWPHAPYAILIAAARRIDGCYDIPSTYMRFVIARYPE